MPGKIFSYDEAQALIPDIRRLTEAANERLLAYRKRLGRETADSATAVKLQEWITALVARWSQDVLDVGALPKGLWTVDFDSGRGYFYCWALGESELSHSHSYEAGFRGRKPLSEEQKLPPPHLLN
jgi:hypothetical protein